MCNDDDYDRADIHRRKQEDQKFFERNQEYLRLKKIKEDQEKEDDAQE